MLIHLPNVYGCVHALTEESSRCGPKSKYLLTGPLRKNWPTLGLELLEPSSWLHRENSLQRQTEMNSKPKHWERDTAWVLYSEGPDDSSAPELRLNNQTIFFVLELVRYGFLPTAAAS